MEKDKEKLQIQKLLESFLPPLLLSHFTITELEERVSSKSTEKYIHIELEEKNVVPAGYAACEYESKGFYKSKMIQDFPIRGKAVYLSIKRRRWRNKSDGTEIHNDYTFIAEGSKLTQDLSDFLKGTGRDPRRYH